MSSSSNVPILSGSTPGLLDPSQPIRILRNPNSQLCFASFHPHTACPDRVSVGFQTNNISVELCRAKRVVVEITQDGSFWRFVPKARREDGVNDEGVWPQHVNICGQVFHCSQDQWDIHMLDPAYTCFLPASPQLPTITRNDVTETTVSRTPAQGSKRALSPDRHFASPPPSAKRHRAGTESDSDDEDEVEEIIRPPSRAGSVGPSRAASVGLSSSYLQQKAKLRAETERIRKSRRDKIKLRQTSLDDIFEDHVMADLSPEDTPPTPRSSQFVRPSSTTKRKDSGPGELQEVDLSNPSLKRVRTRSPESIKRELTGIRAERGKQRAKDKKQKQDQLRRARDEALEREIYGTYPDQQADIDAANAQANAQSSQDSPQDVEEEDIGEEDEEEARRRRLIEESRRKIAEIEKDRPLWEQEAQKRSMREQAEEREREAAQHAQQRASEAERREKERKDREAKLRADREKRQRELDEAIEREREQRRAQEKRSHDQNRWARGPWNIQRALERYKYLCEQFDNAKFGPTKPLTFEDVPWPVLDRSFSVEDIDWAVVEAFFAAIKPHMRFQDYKPFVEKSHRRFHPDRWRARGVLKSMLVNEERECLEVAANTVAQALTPLWREVKQ